MKPSPSIDREEYLKNFSAVISTKRDDAIRARKDSGIESIWMACEEAYLGIDDQTREQFVGARWAKPTSMEGPVDTGYKRPSDDVRSTAFVRLTSRYVDAGAARVAEILLPIDDKPFKFGPTPVPDLPPEMMQAIEQDIAQKNQAAQLQAQQAAMQTGQQPSQLPQTDPKKMAEAVKKAIEAKATEAAEKAEKRIYDWMVESGHRAEMRKVIHDAARIGVGVLKGPVPTVRRSTSASKDKNVMAIEIVEELKPAEKWVDPWNFFPDGSCGEDIHSGDYVFERDYITSRTLRSLKGNPGYIDSAIDKVLEEGPGKCNINEQNNNPHQTKQSNKSKFEVWYFYGMITSKDMVMADPSKAIDIKQGTTDVYAIITLVNDTVIRAVVNPLDSGKFPYYAMAWSRRAGHWAGVGVSEQVEMPQRLVNQGTRALINNAGKSAGSQIVIDQGAITPADGRWQMTPDKIWYKSADAVVDDVRKAFMPFVIPNMTQQLHSVIDYGFRLAEEASNIPLIAQGQFNEQSPQTFGAAQIQNNNANTLLRSIGYSFDEQITEPLVLAYYEWLLLDPDVPDEEKGDFRIDAKGSVALVEQAIQDQTIAEMGKLVLNPQFGVDPKKWFAEYSKSKRMNPNRFMYSDEELEQMKHMPPPEDPRITSAKITAQGWIQREQMRAKDLADHAAAEARMEMERAKIDMSEAEKDRQLELVLAQVNERIEGMKLQGAKEISIDELKAMLAATAAKLRTQADLSLAGHRVDLHKNSQVMTPPTEPVGRAQPGKAFVQ